MLLIKKIKKCILNYTNYVELVYICNVENLYNDTYPERLRE